MCNFALRMQFAVGLIVLLGVVAVTNADCTFDSENCFIRCVGVQSGHPGHQAAQIAVDNYDNCSLPPTQFFLQFDGCKFPNETLDMNWFEPATPGPIRSFRHLDFYNSEVFKFEDGAIAAADAFRDSLQHIKMEPISNFPMATTGLLRGLNNISRFDFSPVEYEGVEAGLLDPVASTLQFIYLYSSHSDSTQVVANLTGMCQNSTFPLLDHMYFKSQPIPVISSKMFTGIVRNGQRFTLGFSDTKVEHLEDNTVFDAFGGDLEYLGLNSNSLTTFPAGLFDKALEVGVESLQLYLADNPWHCDCNLQYLKDIMVDISNGIHVRDVPTCSSPPSQAGVSILFADLSTVCDPLPVVPPVNITC